MLNSLPFEEIKYGFKKKITVLKIEVKSEYMLCHDSGVFV